MNINNFATKSLALLVSAGALLLCGCELFARKPKPIRSFMSEVSHFEPDLTHKIQYLHGGGDIGSDPTNFPNEVRSSFKLFGNLSRWSKFSVGSDVIAPPAVGNGMFFIISKDGRVRAYSIEGQKLIWSASVCSAPLRKASMLLHGDKLYIAADDCLIGFSLEGREVFYRKLHTPIFSGLCLHNQVCYLQTLQGLHAINMETGALLGKILGLPGELSFTHQSRPIIYKDKVIFSAFAGHLAISHTDISKTPPHLIEFVKVPRPKYTILPINSLVSQPLLDGHYCYFATTHGILQKCDLEKKSSIWDLDLPSVQSVSLVGNTLFATTMAGEVAAINPSSGRVVWVTSLQSTGLGQFLPPFIANEALVVVSKAGKVFMLNPQTGAILSKVELPTRETIISAAVSGPKLMLFGDKGSVLENF